MKTTEIHRNPMKSNEMQRSIVKSIEFHTKIKGNHQNRVMKSRKSGDEIRSNPINLMNRTPKYILMAYVCAHRQVPIGGANTYSLHMYANTSNPDFRLTTWC